MSKGLARQLLFLAILACTALFDCCGGQVEDDVQKRQLEDDAQKRQPDNLEETLYSLPPIELDCPSGQFRFKIDERSGQHSVAGTITLVGCEEEIDSLTESNKAGLAQKFREFAREDPLRLVILCCSSSVRGKREALRFMEECRNELLGNLNADFSRPKIVSFVCEVEHGEDI